MEFRLIIAAIVIVIIGIIAAIKSRPLKDVEDYGKDGPSRWKL